MSENYTPMKNARFTHTTAGAKGCVRVCVCGWLEGERMMVRENLPRQYERVYATGVRTLAGRQRKTQPYIIYRRIR